MAWHCLEIAFCVCNETLQSSFLSIRLCESCAYGGREGIMQPFREKFTLLSMYVWLCPTNKCHWIPPNLNINSSRFASYVKILTLFFRIIYIIDGLITTWRFPKLQFCPIALSRYPQAIAVNQFTMKSIFQIDYLPEGSFSTICHKSPKVVRNRKSLICSCMETST